LPSKSVPNTLVDTSNTSVIRNINTFGQNQQQIVYSKPSDVHQTVSLFSHKAKYTAAKGISLQGIF